MGVCDKDGCDLNAYRMGDHDFYGLGLGFEVDSTKPMTVVTQFLTGDGSDSGSLNEIRRLYVQEGRLIHQANFTLPGYAGNSITDQFCSAQKLFFGDQDEHFVKGGLQQMGEALDRGLVLALSIWDDAATHMSWLDATFPMDGNASEPGILRGPCNGTTSDPEYLREYNPNATVKYTNIKYGEIGSTYSEGRRLAPVLV